MRKIIMLAICFVLCLSFAFAESSEQFIISGSGTQILNGIELTDDLSRLIVHCSKDLKLTCYSGTDSFTYDEDTVEYIQNPVSFTALMVEADTGWKLDFSPIGTMETPYCSGVGSYVTDVFTADPPCIVNLSFTEGDDFRYLYVYLNKIDAEGNISTETVIWYEMVLGTVSFDRIIKPEPGVVAYFWTIKCAEDVKWSITAK